MWPGLPIQPYEYPSDEVFPGMFPQEEPQAPWGNVITGAWSNRRYFIGRRGRYVR